MTIPLTTAINTEKVTMASMRSFFEIGPKLLLSSIFLILPFKLSPVAREAPAKFHPSSIALILSAAFRPALLLGQQILQLLDILERQLSGFSQMGHQRPRRTAPDLQQFVDQPPVGRLTRDRRFEDVGAPHLLRPPYRPLLFQPPDNRLHSRIRRTPCLRQSFMNLPDRCAPQVPERFHHLHLKLRQPDRIFTRHRHLHTLPTTNEAEATTFVVQQSS